MKPVIKRTCCIVGLLVTYTAGVLAQEGTISRYTQDLLIALDAGPTESEAALKTLAASTPEARKAFFCEASQAEYWPKFEQSMVALTSISSAVLDSLFNACVLPAITDPRSDERRLRFALRMLEFFGIDDCRIFDDHVLDDRLLELAERRLGEGRALMNVSVRASVCAGLAAEPRTTARLYLLLRLAEQAPVDAWALGLHAFLSHGQRTLAPAAFERWLIQPLWHFVREGRTRRINTITMTAVRMSDEGRDYVVSSIAQVLSWIETPMTRERADVLGSILTKYLKPDPEPADWVSYGLTAVAPWMSASRSRKLAATLRLRLALRRRHEPELEPKNSTYWDWMLEQSAFSWGDGLTALARSIGALAPSADLTVIDGAARDLLGQMKALNGRWVSMHTGIMAVAIGSLGPRVATTTRREAWELVVRVLSRELAGLIREPNGDAYQMLQLARGVAALAPNPPDGITSEFVAQILDVASRADPDPGQLEDLVAAASLFSEIAGETNITKLSAKLVSAIELEADVTRLNELGAALARLPGEPLQPAAIKVLGKLLSLPDARCDVVLKLPQAVRTAILVEQVRNPLCEWVSWYVIVRALEPTLFASRRGSICAAFGCEARDDLGGFPLRTLARILEERTQLQRRFEAK